MELRSDKHHESTHICVTDQISDNNKPLLAVTSHHVCPQGSLSETPRRLAPPGPVQNRTRTSLLRGSSVDLLNQEPQQLSGHRIHRRQEWF